MQCILFSNSLERNNKYLLIFCFQKRSFKEILKRQNYSGDILIKRGVKNNILIISLMI